jgi:hypothetical protein
MKNIKAKVTQISVGHDNDDYCMRTQHSLVAELDGLVDDRHRNHCRECWEGDDKQVAGTVRRNERLWSAMSAEEISDISHQMDLAEPLTAANLSVNMIFEGIPQFSLLPKGTILCFPSGAELLVEEYNPPCLGMGQKLADLLTTNSGQALMASSFTKAATFSRGLVGVVDVPGEISVGDEVIVKVYSPPIWHARQNSRYL